MTLNKVVRSIQPEALFWMAGLLYLAVLNPHSKQHLNFCVPSRLGFGRCLGCGLGRSISYFLHGDLRSSYETHPFGIVATFVLVARSFSLVRQGSHDFVDENN